TDPHSAGPDGFLRSTSISEAAAVGPRWAVTAAGGASATYWGPGSRAGDGAPFSYAAHYQVEVQRQATRDGLIFGAALESGSETPLLGLATFVGSSWNRRTWFFEVTGGLGLEIAEVRRATSTYTNDSATGASSTTTVSGQATPALYARAALTAGVPVGRSFDFVAGLGLHAGTYGFETAYGTVTTGLRFRIP